MNLAKYATTRVSLLIFLLLGLWGTFFYFAMVHEIMDETDDELRSYRDIIVSRAFMAIDLLENEETIFYRYNLNPILNEEAGNYREKWSEEEEYFPIGNEHIPMRVYKSAFCLPDGRCYELDLRISTTERNDLLQSLLIYLIALYLFLVICIFIGNYLILKRSFTPLNKLLIWLRNLTPEKPIPPLENDTPISEFRTLNEAALAMSRRSVETYEEQKKFIENASHELQTPLAIVLNKLELLAENEHFPEELLGKIEEINKPLNRAVKINKSLLLLTRISNNQYGETFPVNIHQLVEENLTDLKELIEYKNLSITFNSDNSSIVWMNDLLGQTLILNLLKNAVIHTEKNGKVKIDLENGTLKIWNSGDHSLDTSLIFNRFYHSSSLRESTGLGLAIVHSIVSVYHFDISYHYENDGHLFVLKFDS